MSDTVTGPAYYFPSIEKKYGQPIEHWLTLIRSSPLSTHKQLIDWLKAEHGLGHATPPPATARSPHAIPTHRQRRRRPAR